MSNKEKNNEKFFGIDHRSFSDLPHRLRGSSNQSGGDNPGNYSIQCATMTEFWELVQDDFTAMVESFKLK